MGRALVVIVALAALGFPTPGEAHDSAAPPGAPHTWLPGEDWVEHHWSPFDEEALEHALGLRGRDLEAFLYDDHRTLAQLAALRGVDVQRLADDLVAPWQGHADDARRVLLRERTLRVLTQGHLAQHVFFHVFHSSGASRVVSTLLEIPRARFLSQRERGLTPLEIARRRGVRASVLHDGLARFFRGHHDHGIRLGVASAPASARILARQLAALPCWLRRPLPSRDAGNPYGKAFLQHGEHPAGWPATPGERRVDEARVERVRASLRRSCWRPPPPWSWSAHGLRPAAKTHRR